MSKDHISLNSIITSVKNSLANGGQNDESDFVKRMKEQLAILKQGQPANSEIKEILGGIFDMIYEEFRGKLENYSGYQPPEQKDGVLETLKRGFGRILEKEDFEELFHEDSGYDYGEIKQRLETFPEHVLADVNFLAEPEDKTYWEVVKLAEKLVDYATNLELSDDNVVVDQISCFSLADVQEINCIPGSVSRLETLADSLIKNPLIIHHQAAMRKIYAQIIDRHGDKLGGNQVHLMPYIQIILGVRDEKYMSEHGDMFYTTIPDDISLESALQIMDDYRRYFQESAIGELSEIINDDELLRAIIGDPRDPRRVGVSTELKKLGLNLDDMDTQIGLPLCYNIPQDEDGDFDFTKITWNRDLIKKMAAEHVSNNLGELVFSEFPPEPIDCNASLKQDSLSQKVTDLILSGINSSPEDQDKILRGINIIYMATQEFNDNEIMVAIAAIYGFLDNDQLRPKTHEEYVANSERVLEVLRGLLPEHQRFKIDKIIEKFKEDDLKQCLAVVAKINSNEELLTNLNFSEDDLLLGALLNTHKLDLSLFSELDAKKIKKFLRLQMDSSDPDMDQCSVLQTLAMKGRAGSLRIMLEKLSPDDIFELFDHDSTNTPLYFAAKHNHPEVAEVVLQSLKSLPDTEIKAFIDSAYEIEFTALETAARSGHHDIVKVIVNFLKEKVQSDAEGDWYEFGKTIITERDGEDDDYKTSILAVAVDHDSPEMVKMMLEYLTPDDRRIFVGRALYDFMSVNPGGEIVKMVDVILSASEGKDLLDIIMDVNPDDIYEPLIQDDQPNQDLDTDGQSSRGNNSIQGLDADDQSNQGNISTQGSDADDQSNQGNISIQGSDADGQSTQGDISTQGLDSNDRPVQGGIFKTCLFNAIKIGRVDVVNLILRKFTEGMKYDKGDDLSQEHCSVKDLFSLRDDSTKTTYLHYAVLMNPMVLKEILKYIEPKDRLELLEMKDSKGLTPLDIAIKNSSNKSRYSAESIKAILGSLEVDERKRLIFGSGDEVLADNSPQQIPETCLHRAIDGNKIRGLSAILDGLTYGLERVEKSALIKEVLSQKTDGDTFLHNAAKHQNPRILQRILKYAALDDKKELLEMKDSDGRTVIDLAKENGNLEYMETLLETLNPPEAPTESNKRPRTDPASPELGGEPSAKKAREV